MRTKVGYTGGTTVSPTYRNLGDHTESIHLEFDPELVSYEDLLWMFWKGHDPTTSHKRQYMSAIFYHDEEQRHLAEKTRDELQKSIARPVVTVISQASTFYDAEDYHQKYMLRQDRQLLAALKLTDAELIRSTTAAKLNGYVRGFGTLESFENDQKDFALPASMLNQVKRKLQH
ncbi:peptide methionine sulfoxide reductase-like [Babylonia areolata]|uniref:peptide methionine sulfoxide reductase-like n=1 Tax=Babylonia areolata TaxID=304850 RepID=UPI003FD42A4E